MRRLFIVSTKKLGGRTYRNIPESRRRRHVFFLDNSSTDFETIRRHFMRQLDDTFILSEALEVFFKDTDILAKNLQGYKENHIPIINRLKK